MSSAASVRKTALLAMQDTGQASVRATLRRRRWAPEVVVVTLLVLLMAAGVSFAASDEGHLIALTFASEDSRYKSRTM